VDAVVSVPCDAAISWEVGFRVPSVVAGQDSRVFPLASLVFCGAGMTRSGLIGLTVAVGLGGAAGAASADALANRLPARTDGCSRGE
jgi:hypothetical protein